MQNATKAQLKKIRELMRDGKFRDETGLFIAEGRKIIRDMIEKKHRIDSALMSDRFTQDTSNKGLIKQLTNRQIPVLRTRGTEFERVSSLQHSQGVLCVAAKHKLPDLKLMTIRKNDIYVLCDGIQDPGNMGALIRTSLAFGVKALLLTGKTVDIYNPKVVRASSGMILDIPVYKCDLAAVKRLQGAGCCLLASFVPQQGSKKDVATMKKPGRPVILAFGSEGKGVSKQVLDGADDIYYIPIDKKVESLNVVAAAAVSLFIFSRNK